MASRIIRNEPAETARYACGCRLSAPRPPDLHPPGLHLKVFLRRSILATFERQALTLQVAGTGISKMHYSAANFYGAFWRKSKRSP
jgi:hypothetical protein